MERCQDIMELLAAYADGELAGELRDRVERHVEQCARCRAEAAELRKLPALLRSCPVREPAPHEWQKASMALESCMAERRSGLAPHARRTFRLGWWLFPAAAVAAAVVFAVLFATAPTVDHAGTSSDVLINWKAGPNYEVETTHPQSDNDVIVIDVTGIE